MDLPSATYRLQLDPAQMDLAAAAELVPYLDQLGVSHVYVSPLLRSRPGSPHGYDTVDPGLIDPQLGGRTGLDRMVTALHDHGMRLILDVVPNHMAIGQHNPWWMDVLENGPKADHSGHFDLFWDDDGLSLPLLGRPYVEALDAGELTIGIEGGAVRVAYWDERFPLSAESLRSAGLDAADPEIHARIAAINADHRRIASASR